MLLRLAALAALVLAPSQALAEWYKASSKHFIIYADQNPSELRAFATKLERFDQAVRYARNMEDVPVGDGNRLTIFVLKDLSAVQGAAGDDSGYLAGFYVPDAAGSLAFVPQSTGATQVDPEIVLLHEYAHHILLQDLDRPYPEWLVEGFAELLSTAWFKKDGTIQLGRAANHRYYGVYNWSGLSLQVMLSGNYGNLTSRQRETIYGKGWLLTHYLTFTKGRQGQLEVYLDLMAKGTAPLDAARSAFGSLAHLDRILWGYMQKRRITVLSINTTNFQQPTIEIQPLSAGAAQVLPQLIELKRGRLSESATDVAAKVRRAQTAAKGDPLVELTLGLAELNADHPDAAERAADRALAASPSDVEAMILKAKSIMAAEALPPQQKRVAEARSWLTKANRLDVNDPEPLIEFYKSFLVEGVKPTANAVAALHHASDLAPQDLRLRLTSAIQYLRDGDRANARQRLTMIAYNPHGRSVAQLARTLIDQIDAGEIDAILKAGDSPLGLRN
jgi:tetratricopeptide (TPR) repeat protein